MRRNKKLEFMLIVEMLAIKEIVNFVELTLMDHLKSGDHTNIKEEFTIQAIWGPGSME